MPVPDSPAASSLRYQMDVHVDERAPEGSPQEKGSQAPVGNGSPSKHNWTAIEGDGEAAANSFYAYSTSTLPRELFDNLDEDKNGYLDRDECRKLIQLLKRKLPVDQLFDEMLAEQTKSAETVPDGSVAFDNFMRVYNDKLGTERRQVRQEVKLMFEKLDTDHTEKITKEQVHSLVKRIRKRLMLLHPPFDIDKDWNLMIYAEGGDPTDPGSPSESVGISFNGFETWWKARMGLYEADTPVIPEYIAHRLENIVSDSVADGADAPSAAALGAGAGNNRSAKHLWAFLRPRLRMMVTMNQEWGHLRDVYGHSESIFIDAPIHSCIINPDTTFATMWDIFSLSLLLYVTVAVPFRACFGVMITPYGGIWCFDLVIDVYFYLDIIYNFRLAYRDSRGVRQSNPSDIAKNYLTGWFLLDFVACLPVNHIAAALNTEGKDNGQSNSKFIKILRLLRLSKLLRLARIKRMLEKYSNSYVLQQYLAVFMLLIIIVFTTHFLTCFWFLVGTFDDSTIRIGWVDRETLGLMDGSDPRWGFNDTANDDSLVSGGSRYITSMYYVFNPVENGLTDAERVFAIVAYMLLVVVDGSVAGLISATLVGMNGGEREISDKLRAVKTWMMHERIPKGSQAKALGYFQQLYKSRIMYNEAEIISSMPPAMRNVFAMHIYEKFLKSIPMFKDLSDEIIASLCRVIEPMVAVKNQVIFSEGSTGKELYMLMSGELEVSRGGERLGFLSEGAFFGEVPLLSTETGAEIRKRTIIACTDCKICYLPILAVRKIMRMYPALMLRVKRVSRFGLSRVNKKGNAFKEAMKDAEDVKQGLDETDGAATPARDADGKPIPTGDTAALKQQLTDMDNKVDALGRELRGSAAQTRAELSAKLDAVLVALQRVGAPGEIEMTLPGTPTRGDEGQDAQMHL